MYSQTQHPFLRGYWVVQIPAQKGLWFVPVRLGWNFSLITPKAGPVVDEEFLAESATVGIVEDEGHWLRLRLTFQIFM